ncbi:MAG: hypothetical protein HFJ29_08370 [Clostridia bacterium]|jgi:hypothetical protein|nr:hypothetical protein [Clostridia bacterium]
MNTKEEYLRSLNTIDKFLKEEKYEEARNYIKQKKFEINMREEDKAADYIDKLVDELK